MLKKILNREIIYEDNSALKYLEDENVLEDIEHDKQRHKHDDYQIVIVTRGKIKGFVGSYLGDYKYGDIIAVGKNVPHFFNLKLEKCEQSDGPNEIEILHFKHELLPVKLDDISELNFIHLLLKRCSHGILFRDKTLFEKIRTLLYRIDDLKGIRKLNELFLILDTLGKCKNFTLISLEEYNPDNDLVSNNSALQRTYHYLYSNFRDNITLESLSEYSHQNPTALCRTFKREAGKTIFQFLNKLRIENACKLLLETDMNISQVAYESGYSNLPHFNKQFRLITGNTPSEYRELMKSW